MRESFIEALVLDRREAGECDTLADLYTKERGKIIARAKSARKIASKLGPYLEPLNLIEARVLENGRATFQIVDALGVAKFSLTPENLRLLELVNRLTFDLEPDPRLWNALCGSLTGRAEGGTAVSRVLAVLGYDPAHAACASCGKPPEHFSTADAAFYCKACSASWRTAFQSAENELISLN